MMDITTSLFASIDFAFKSVKSCIDGYAKMKDSERKHRLAELLNSLSDVKMQEAMLKATLLEKDEEIENLKARLKRKENVKPTVKNRMYTFEDKPDMFFCPSCWDNEQRCQVLSFQQAGGIRVYSCPQCGFKNM